MISGPKAVASRYTDMAITDSVLLMCSSWAIVERAGAMIVETMMRFRPVAERMLVTRHFLRVGQSLGFKASGEENVTRKGSSRGGVVCAEARFFSLSMFGVAMIQGAEVVRT